MRSFHAMETRVEPVFDPDCVSDHRPQMEKVILFLLRERPPAHELDPLHNLRYH